ncbi:MAG: hypothetical protein M1818_007207 [Claussenomyces sp. TS43310]|nr:MAG: hypothetical protein M1818_007207 [Claussenomyces sp. TS43310]
MRPRTSAYMTRVLSQGIGSVRHASVIAAPSVERGVKPKLPAEQGQRIFAFSHLQTKQVVYSLNRSMKVKSIPTTPSALSIHSIAPPTKIKMSKGQFEHLSSFPQNKHALSQLPYNGKKTVPRALRKDLWAPLATIEFPTTSDAAHQGLLTFQKLREYRKLHETQWGPDLSLDERGRPLSRKARGRKLRDQRANSVADMAAALASVTVRGPEGKDGQGRSTEVAAAAPAPAGSDSVSSEAKKEDAPDAVAAPVVVRWADILDAEYAESWPANVVHDRWETTRNNRKAPVVDEVLQGTKRPAQPAQSPARDADQMAELPKDAEGRVIL